MMKTPFDIDERTPFSTSEETPVTGGISADLTDYPFPLALAEMYHGRKSGVLRIRRGDQETHIVVKDGSPVRLDSSAPEDSLEHLLVKRGRVETADAFAAKGKAVETGRSVGEVLVEQELLEPDELPRLIKLNMGQNLLAIFGWSEGEVLFDPRPPLAGGSLLLEVDPEPLILRGVSAYSPLEVIDKAFRALGEDRFRLDRDPDEVLTRLHLSGEQEQVLRALHLPRDIGEMVATAGGDEEALKRLLYTLVLLRIVVPEPERPVRAEPEEPEEPEALEVLEELEDIEELEQFEEFEELENLEEAPSEEAPTGIGVPATTIQALREALATARDGSYYDLLGVKPDAGFEALKHAFLDRCYELSPMSLRGKFRRVRQAQVEDLFLLLVRAYGTLSNARQRRAYNERLRRARGPGKPRKTRALRATSTSAPAPGTQAAQLPAAEIIEPTVQSPAVQRAIMFIRTGKLPAAVQDLREAVLKAPNDGPAVALLGYSLHLLDPEENLAPATAYLQHAGSMDPSAMEPCLYLGRVCEAAEDRTGAMQAYQQCLALDPGQEEARAAMRRLRGQRGKK